jgi:hypothetical protein
MGKGDRFRTIPTAMPTPADVSAWTPFLFPKKTRDFIGPRAESFLQPRLVA